MPKQPRRAVGHSAVQVFPGHAIDGKLFEVPDGRSQIIGKMRTLVGVTFACNDAILTGRHEPRPIRYGQETPDVIQMIFDVGLLEGFIGFLASLRDASIENLLVKPEAAVLDEAEVKHFEAVKRATNQTEEAE